jgi:hypothetical protein
MRKTDNQMIQIEASSYGPELVNLVSSRGGRLIGVLGNGIYLESFEGYVVGVVDEDGVDGPLTLRVRNLRAVMETVRGGQGLRFEVPAARRHIEIGGQVAISLCGAQAWQPGMPECMGDEASRNEAMNALVEAIIAFAPDRPSAIAIALEAVEVVRRGAYEGAQPASSAPRPVTTSALVSRHVAACVRRFVGAWSNSDAAGAGDALVSLLGLGEGLTPSGDDVVSGILAALAWRARLDAMPASTAESLAERVLKASSRTNRISARLLHYASRGILYAPALELGAALLEGDAKEVQAPAQRLLAVGNTTGTDLAAGLIVGLR